MLPRFGLHTSIQKILFGSNWVSIVKISNKNKFTVWFSLSVDATVPSFIWENNMDVGHIMWFGHAYWMLIFAHGDL